MPEVTHSLSPRLRAKRNGLGEPSLICIGISGRLAREQRHRCPSTVPALHLPDTTTLSAEILIGLHSVREGVRAPREGIAFRV